MVRFLALIHPIKTPELQAHENFNVKGQTHKLPDETTIIENNYFNKYALERKTSR